MKNCKYGNRLREWRTNAGFSLSEVAGLTGISVPMLSLAETGQRRFSPHAKIAISRRLGVSLATLFDPEPIPGLMNLGKKAAR
jgi:transcriptional regulator with XRE-family HTH domain